MLFQYTVITRKLPLSLFQHILMLFQYTFTRKCCTKYPPQTMNIFAPANQLIGKVQLQQPTQQRQEKQQALFQVECPVGDYGATIICPDSRKCFGRKDKPFLVLGELKVWKKIQFRIH